ncbi:serine hydrolase domain-containing protein [Gangjinia marincola]|uniref:Serine hydrolase domain-containing protein n=1 Tax=Gangjinia marincola TaxID=578463 RepID=A0ABP3XTD1_9FLAO
MKKWLPFVFLLTTLVCSAQNKSIEAYAGFIEKIDSLHIEHQIPGLSVGVMRNDSILISTGVGWANVEAKKDMTAQTPVRIASLTKPIFSTLFMRLEEEGNVDLNWKIKNYVPNYLERCERILAYFEKQMPEYAFLLKDYEPNRDDILLKHHLSHTAEASPGTNYKYNGLLYGMLSAVMKTATGVNFDRMVDSLIIQKLELKHAASSQLDDTKTELLNTIALPYHFSEDDSFVRSPFPDKDLNAGAGLVFSVEDLLLFDKALTHNTIISNKAKEKMFEPFLLNDGRRSPYGYGWFIDNYKNNKVIWHYGWQPKAYSSLYVKIPEKNLTLVMLTNSEGLSSSFNLSNGNLLQSVFAQAFLDQFVTD